MEGRTIIDWEKNQYFELDNALFRTNPGCIGVQEVWDGKQWVKYTGDGFKPWAEGTKLKESDLPQAARFIKAAE